MRFPLVMKVGGAGLSDGPAVLRACELVAAQSAQDPIVVVSAHEGVTESLHRCARDAALGQLSLEALRLRHKGLLRQLALDPELLDRLLTELGQVLYSLSERGAIEPEELDFVLSFGERMSARVVAASLRARGVVATPVDAFDLGLTTDSCHGSARPLPGVEASLRRSLGDLPGVPVVTGFLAKDHSGKLTTMGRNGSDLTASLVARAAGARRLVFWKSVPGVMTADPSLVGEATVIERLSFVDAEALAFHGADVLHASALEPVRHTPLVVEVRDVRQPAQTGTSLEELPPSAGPVAIAGSAALHGILVPPEAGEPPSTLFALMHAHHVRPRYLLTGPEGVTIYAPEGTGFELLRRELSVRALALPDLASVVVVGGGAAAGRAALDLLVASNLIPDRVQVSEGSSSQVLLVAPERHAGATRAVHAGLLARAPA